MVFSQSTPFSRGLTLWLAQAPIYPTALTMGEWLHAFGNVNGEPGNAGNIMHFTGGTEVNSGQRDLFETANVTP